MENAIISVQSQHTSSFAASMKSGTAAQESPQAQQQAAAVKSTEPSGFSSITYSSKGQVEPVPVQAAANAGFEAVA